MAATGYSALSIATTAEAWYKACLAEYSKLATHLPTGWTVMPGGNFDTNTRTEVFDRMKRALVESSLFGVHKTEYLAQIYDSTELSKMEVYCCLAYIFSLKTTLEGDYFDKQRSYYDDKFRNFLSANHIQIDETVTVTESNTSVCEASWGRLRLVRG